MNQVNPIWQKGFLFYARAHARKWGSAIACGLLVSNFSSGATAVSRSSFQSAIQNLSSADLGVCLPAAETLGRSHRETAVAPLANALASEKRPVVRRYLVDALGTLRFPEGRPALIRALADEDTQVRISAVVALDWVGGKASDEALIARASAETDKSVKLHLVRMLGRSRHSKAPSALEHLRNDVDPDVRQSAALELQTRAPGKGQ